MPNIELDDRVLEALDGVKLEEMREIMKTGGGQKDGNGVGLVVDDEDSFFRIDT
jgi:hypothetical protein